MQVYEALVKPKDLGIPMYRQDMGCVFRPSVACRSRNLW